MAPARAGAAAVDILPDFRGFGGAFLVGMRKQIGGMQAATQSSMQKVGASLTKTLTPIAAAGAFGLKKSFDEYHEGMAAIRVGTGATGEALDDLGGSFKTVAGNITAPLSSVGDAMAELRTRTGQAGEPLEQLTTSFLQLEKITGEAASTTIPAITRLFGDWSVATTDQVATMDELFRISQVSGISVGRLSELMVQFGSPLRQLGLDMETTAAMFARFEKEGVNIQTAMPGLRMALKNFAKDGREPAPALQETIEAIKGAATTADANTLAFETFGVRAGPDLAAAIREGRFELGEYLDAMKNGEDTIAQATKDTETLSDKVTKLGNRIMTTLGPFGEWGALLLGGVAAIGPLVFGIGALTTALKGASLAAVASTAGVAALIALPVVAAIATWTMAFNAWKDAQKAQAESVEASERLVVQLTKSMAAGTMEHETFVRRYQQALADESLSAEEREQVQGKLNEALRTYNQAVRDGLDPSKALEEHFGGTADAAAGQNAAVDDGTRALKDQAQAAGELQLAQLGLASSFLGIQGAAYRARDAERDLTEAREELHRIQAGLPASEEEVTDARTSLREATLGVRDAELALRDAQNTVRDARKKLAQLEEGGYRGTKAYAEARRELRDATLDQERAELSLQQAKEREAEATRALGLAEGKIRDPDELAEARRNYRDALLSAQEAQLGLASATAQYVSDMTQKGAPTQAEVNRLIGQMGAKAGLTKDEVRRLRRQVLGLVDDLEKLPKDVGVNIKLTVGQQAEADRLTALAEAFQKAGLAGPSRPRRRQFGGPVEPFAPYLVGEAGPEVFRSAVAGRIEPNAGAVTKNVVINIHGGDTAKVKRAVADALNEDGRRQGDFRRFDARTAVD